MGFSSRIDVARPSVRARALVSPAASASRALAGCAGAIVLLAPAPARASEIVSDLTMFTQVKAGLNPPPFVPPIELHGQTGPVDRQRFVAAGVRFTGGSRISSFAHGWIGRGSMRIDFLADAFSTNDAVVQEVARTVVLGATYNDWVITPPASYKGPMTIETRVRMTVTTTHDFGTTGAGSGSSAYDFQAYAGSLESRVAWVDDKQVIGVPSNTYLSDFMLFPVGQAFTFTMGLASQFGEIGHLLMGAPIPGGSLTSAASTTLLFGGLPSADGLSASVLDLPEGFSLESVSANIHGNLLREPPVPAPAPLALALACALGGAQRRRR